MGDTIRNIGQFSREAKRLSDLYRGLKTITRPRFVFQGRDRFWYQRHHPNKKTVSVFYMGWRGIGRREMPIIMGGAPDTYYMRADGGAANKGAAGGPGSSVGDCMDYGTYAGDTYAAGDELVLCDDGGSFNVQFEAKSDGTSGSPIVYKAEDGDTPIIHGDYAVTGWADQGSNVWAATLNTDPVWIVVINDVLGNPKKASAAACVAEGDWFWTANTLSVYSESEPTNVRSAQNSYAFYINDFDYITIEGITARYTTVDAIRSNNTLGTTLRNLIVTGASDSGVRFTNSSDMGDQSHLVDTCAITRAHNGAGVELVGTALRGITVQDTTISDIISESNQGDCIRFSGCHDSFVLRNHCTNGTVDGGSNADGIDQAGGDDNLIAYNVVVGTGGSTPDSDGMAVKGSSDGTLFYNNIVYKRSTDRGTSVCIYLTDTSTNTVLKNNIFLVASGADADYMCFYEDTSGSWTSENNLILNGATAANIAFANSSNRTWAQWQGLGYDANGLNVDPQWINEAGLDFHLQSDSPCIEAGTPIIALKLDKDKRLLGRGINPDIGAFETLKGGPRAI